MNKMLIGSDFDGTLNRGGISQEDRNAIDQWRKNGNLFGVVTGRDISSIERELKKLEMPYDFLVSNNGGEIYSENGERLFGKTVDKSHLRELVGYIYDNGGIGCGCAHDRIHSDIFNKNNGPKEPDETVLSEIGDFVQVNTYFSTERESLELAEKVNRRFNGIFIAYQNGVCVDIPAYGVSKATGVAEVAKIFGIALDDCITVGDNYNDLAMIEAFHGAAVANAVPLIKEKASVVVRDFTELTAYFTEKRKNSSFPDN